MAKKAAGDRWQDNDLVFASKVGTELDSHNVRRSFRAVLKKAGLNAQEWTPSEMRHSFVSMLSDAGMPIEASLAWSGTATPAPPERSPANKLRPLLLERAEAVDQIFRDL
ncbi:tyrosine-type recombinase/integrase [Nonomuraea sp. NPDC050786]|uniref:tyrosine-type recombinase/integrase n=1 Tax=Nonomuraea sp. NPDC050786 TaxID=3154840 RepID=UPI0033D98879